MSSTRADRGIEDVRPGCVYAWLCTLATVEGLARGRACWAARQIGNRPTPVNGCPQDDPSRDTKGSNHASCERTQVAADGYRRSGSGSPEAADRSILWMSRFRG